MAKLREVGLDFLETAPRRWQFSQEVSASPARVFQAISTDPTTWTEWFPGLKSVTYEGNPPHGVGTPRMVRLKRTYYRETMLAWDAPRVWTYRIDETNSAIAHALVEEWRIEPSSAGGSTVQWTFAIDPRLALAMMRPVTGLVLGNVFRRAVAGLDRYLST